MSSRFDDLRFTPIWRRVVAAILDSFIVTVILVAINLAMIFFLRPPSADETGDLQAIGVIAVLFVLLLQLGIIFVLYPWAIGHEGQTFGMKAVGVEIVSARTCELISTGSAILRWLANFVLPAAVAFTLVGLHFYEVIHIDNGRWLSAVRVILGQPVRIDGISLTKVAFLVQLPFLFNAAVALMTRKKQRLNDVICGTVAVVQHNDGSGDSLPSGLSGRRT